MLSKTDLQALTVTSGLGGRLLRGYGMSPGAFLSKSELEGLLAGAVRTTVISGGAAGDHTVTGIAVGDALRSVIALDPAHTHTLPDDTSGSPVNAEVTGGGLLAVAGAPDIPSDGVITPDDLTAEFAITGPDTIHNDAVTGTDTTGMVLIVVYEDLTP